MDRILNASIRSKGLTCMIVFMLFYVTLPGCLSSGVAEQAFKGEPQGGATFVLTVSDNVHEINRFWEISGLTRVKTVSIARSDLPAGCDTTRFFLNEMSNELQVARLAYTNWNTGAGKPPYPDEIYHPCSLLVSYGSFLEMSESEGVFITGVKGLVATGKMQKPHPVATSALAPVGMVAEGYLWMGVLVASPVLLPAALIWEDNKLQQKEKARGTLPEPVGACWAAIDSVIKDGLASDQPFVYFMWVPDSENSYVLRTEDEVFSDDKPLLIDTRVTLKNGRVQIQPINTNLWTDADVECGLQAGAVVATFVKLCK